MGPVARYVHLARSESWLRLVKFVAKNVPRINHFRYASASFTIIISYNLFYDLHNYYNIQLSIGNSSIDDSSLHTFCFISIIK